MSGIYSLKKFLRNRRTFLEAAAGAAAFGALPLYGLAAQHKAKIKIADVKCMTVWGTWDWNLIKVQTDAGIHGLGEAYWGTGVRDMIERQLKRLIIGEDKLNVEKLYTKMLMVSGGYGALAGVTGTAASGREAQLGGPARKGFEPPPSYPSRWRCWRRPRDLSISASPPRSGGSTALG